MNERQRPAGEDDGYRRSLGLAVVFSLALHVIASTVAVTLAAARARPQPVLPPVINTRFVRNPSPAPAPPAPVARKPERKLEKPPPEKPAPPPEKATAKPVKKPEKPPEKKAPKIVPTETARKEPARPPEPPAPPRYELSAADEARTDSLIEQIRRRQRDRPMMSAEPAVEGAWGDGPGIQAEGCPLEMSIYNEDLKRLLTETFSYPAGGASLSAEVLLEVGKTGKLIGHKVLKKSGNAIFDDSALRAVEDSQPLPPLPRCFTGRSWRHIFEFVPDEGRQG